MGKYFREPGAPSFRKFGGENYNYAGYVIGLKNAKERAAYLRGEGLKVRMSIPTGIGGKKAKNVREIWVRRK